jgi:hypothetical protein
MQTDDDHRVINCNGWSETKSCTMLHVISPARNAEHVGALNPILAYQIRDL